MEQDIQPQELTESKPTTSSTPAVALVAGRSASEDGAWEMTQLAIESAIGDLQRGVIASNSMQEMTDEVTSTTTDDVNVNQAVRRGSSRKKRRPKPPRVVPTLRVYVGTFVHSTTDCAMEILDRWMVGVDNGKIVLSQSVTEYTDMLETHKLKEFEKECIVRLPGGSVMMPGFIDCHTHVVSYLLAGLRSKFDSIQQSGIDNGVNERRIRTMNVISNDKSAAQLFTTYVSQSLVNGITCAAYNGSVVESAARLLVDAVVRLKQRALVGLEMYYGDNRDDTHMFQLIKAHDVAQHIRRKQCDRVQPCLVLSKPLPDWIEARVNDMATELSLPIKLVVGDEKTETLKEKLKGWVELGAKSSLGYHKKQSLLDNKCILVNCSQCSSRDLSIISHLSSPVVYCPSADLFCGQYNTLQKLSKKNITIGLGTDLNTSHSVSMLETMRTASLCLKLATKQSDSEGVKKSSLERRPVQNVELNGDGTQKIELEELEWKDNKELCSDDEDDNDEEEDDDCEGTEVLSFKDLFRMATLGGATVLGLDDKIGNFGVGKEFDALLVEPEVKRSKFVVVSNFDTVQDVVEKFIYLGDDRNITQVFIAGERVL